MERVFELSGVLVMPFWVGMIFLPGFSVTRRIMASWVAPMVPAAAYAILVAPRFAELFPLLTAPQAGPIAALLGTVEGATIAWIHFLCFDLFVGRWIYLDARERRLPAMVVSPVLFLTLMFGPIGFLSYLAVRALAARATAQSSALLGGAP